MSPLRLPPVLPPTCRLLKGEEEDVCPYMVIITNWGNVGSSMGEEEAALYWPEADAKYARYRPRTIIYYHIWTRMAWIRQVPALKGPLGSHVTPS